MWALRRGIDDTRRKGAVGTGQHPTTVVYPHQTPGAENAVIRQMAAKDLVIGQPPVEVRKRPAGAGPVSAHSFSTDWRS